MNVPRRFLDSYADTTAYPSNLIKLSVSSARASQYQQFLNHPTHRLCMDRVEEASSIAVGFRDWVRGDPACHKKNVKDDIKLADWLGDHSALLPLGNRVTKADPVCRFIFLASPTGRSALWITTQMLRRILSYHQIPAEYLDYLALFGEQENPNDLKFGQFEGHRTLQNPPSIDLVVNDLGRSGRHYEMCFNLKGAELRDTANGTPTALDHWSIRQAAMYHKLDVVSGNAIWMITKATWSLKETFRIATGDGSSPNARTFDDFQSAYKSSLAAHLLITEWAAESWWRYLRCLEDELQEKTKGDALTTGSTKTPKQNDYPVFTRKHLQDVIFYEEKATQAALVLKTNISVLQAMRKFYVDLTDDSDFPLTPEIETATKSFTGEIHRIETEMEGFRLGAEYLASHASNRKQLVLNIMQAQSSDYMTDMTKRSIEEAITMRIITVVTLIFLPATFVSTFFSTDIVKYQPQDAGEPYHTQYSSLAMNRWLQVTLPLTLVTLLGALGLYSRARRPLKQLDFAQV